MRIFLSHNKADKLIARSLGAELVLAGADVWFDEWEIRAGDSIPGKLNEGLNGFDVFILLWSQNAAKSDWVRVELETALYQVIQTGKGKVVPCLLDDTPLPPLLRAIKGTDFSKPTQASSQLVDDLLGFKNRKDKLRAIQESLNDMNLSFTECPTCKPYICCPECGAEKCFEGWESRDEKRDDHYVGIKCNKCGWSDGGEL